MSLRFDHAIILSHDLKAAIAHYQSQGFNAIYGGEHAGGKTHNALIVFADGSYLELLAPTSPALLNQLDPGDRSSFLFLMAQSEPLGGYALLSDALEADVAAMHKRGLPITLGTPNGRARPDGQLLRWRSAVQDSGSMTPFFLQDITPRERRVPTDLHITKQPNGITGIKILNVTVPNLAAAIRTHYQITGVMPEQQDASAAKLTLNSVDLMLTLVSALNVPAQLTDLQLQTAAGDSISIKQFFPR